MSSLGDYGVSISIEWLLSTIGAKKCELESYRCDQVGQGQGFMSKILRVRFSWKEETTPLPASVVVKVPNQPKRMKDDIFEDEGLECFIKTSHYNECKIYEWIRGKGGPAFIPTPVIYHTQEITPENVGVIVMEDLTPFARPESVADGLSMGQVLPMIRSVAKLHAQSIVDPEWRRSIQKLPIWHFEKLPRTLGALKHMLKEKWGERLPLLDALDKWINPEYLLEIVNNPPSPSVLVHGDLWTNNVLFDTGDQQSLVAIIDWQAVRAGLAAEDLVRMLFCLDGEIRRSQTDKLLKEYLECLSGELGMQPFSFASLRESYTKITPFVTLFTVLPLPIWINDGLLNEPDKIDNLFRRTNMILEDVSRIEL